MARTGKKITWTKRDEEAFNASVLKFGNKY